LYYPDGKTAVCDLSHRCDQSAPQQIRQLGDVRRDASRVIACELPCFRVSGSTIIRTVMLITKFTPYLMLITEIRFFARQVSAITFFA
jgi:hypothetical protein